VQIYHAGQFEERRNVMLHAHNFPELVLVYRGQCHIQTPHETCYLDAGELIVIPRHVSHDQRFDSDCTGVFYVGADWPEQLLSHELRVIDMRSEPAARQWISDLVDQYKNEPTVLPVVLQGLLGAVLGRIKRTEQVIASRTHYHAQLSAALQFIDEHLTDDLTVQEIADHVGCSASHLTALFRQDVGCGPIAYQIRGRLRLACKHLLEPYLNVKQVASVCGWHDTNLFVRIFRQRMGVPPGKWRQQKLVETAVSNIEIEETQRC
jgi:AraC-like DNA-binding protein